MVSLGLELFFDKSKTHVSSNERSVMFELCLLVLSVGSGEALGSDLYTRRYGVGIWYDG